MQKAIYIEGNRDGYSPKQCESRTMTIGELINELTAIAEEWGYDSKVFLRNDNGYTYGSVAARDISEGAFDGDHAYITPDDMIEGMVNWQGAGWYLLRGETRWFGGHEYDLLWAWVEDVYCETGYPWAADYLGDRPMEV